MITGNGTIGQIIHDLGLLLVELFDVEYYRDLYYRDCINCTTANAFKRHIGLQKLREPETK